MADLYRGVFDVIGFRLAGDGIGNLQQTSATGSHRVKFLAEQDMNVVECVMFWIWSHEKAGYHAGQGGTYIYEVLDSVGNVIAASAPYYPRVYVNGLPNPRGGAQHFEAVPISFSMTRGTRYQFRTRNIASNPAGNFTSWDCPWLYDNYPSPRFDEIAYDPQDWGIYYPDGVTPQRQHEPNIVFRDAAGNTWGHPTDDRSDTKSLPATQTYTNVTRRTVTEFGLSLIGDPGRSDLTVNINSGQMVFTIPAAEFGREEYSLQPGYWIEKPIQTVVPLPSPLTVEGTVTVDLTGTGYRIRPIRTGGYMGYFDGQLTQSGSLWTSWGGSPDTTVSARMFLAGQPDDSPPDPTPNPLPTPERITIDLGSTHNLTSFYYLPRQDTHLGRVRDWELHVSDNLSTWGAATASGVFPNTATAQNVNVAATGRYVRLSAVSVEGESYATVAELEFEGAPVAPPDPDPPFGLGQRIASWVINREQVLTDLDIVAVAGSSDKAIAFSFPVVPGNYANDPRLEHGDLTRWTVVNQGGTWAIDTGDPLEGAFSLSYNSASQTSVASATNFLSSAMPVTTDDQVEGRVLHQVKSGVPNQVALEVRWYDSNLTQLSVETSPYVTPGNELGELRFTAISPPAGAAFARVYILVASDGNIGTVLFDRYVCRKTGDRSVTVYPVRNVENPAIAALEMRALDDTLPPPTGDDFFTIPLGSDISATINTQTQFTHFKLQAGTYWGQSLNVTRDNIRITGAGRHITFINGGREITSWSPSGANYISTGHTDSQLNVNQGHTGVFRAERHVLTLDNDWCHQVKSVADLQTAPPDGAAANWFFDFAADTIYLSVNPAGKTVALSENTGAVRGTGLSLTVEDLTVTCYHPQEQEGAVGTLWGTAHGGNWLFTNVEVANIWGVGVQFRANNCTFRNGHIHHIGQLGFGSATVNFPAAGESPTWVNLTNIVLHNTLIEYTNMGGYDPGWEAGATKLQFTDQATVTHNEVRFNYGFGIWSDILDSEFVVKWNYVHDNWGPGITHELGFSATIDENWVLRCGRWPTDTQGDWPNQLGGGYGWGSVPGILIAESDGTYDGMGGISVRNNRVEANRGGVMLRQVTRAEHWALSPKVKATSVHNNDVWWDRAIHGGVDSASDSLIFSSYNNTFQNNDYTIDGTYSTPAEFAWSYTTFTFSGWQAQGLDTLTAGASAPTEPYGLIDNPPDDPPDPDPPPVTNRVRINCGGDLLSGTPDWEDDTPGHPYNLDTVGTGVTVNYTGPVTFAPSVPASTPQELFHSERYDWPDPSSMGYAIPVTVGGTHTINIYLCENYSEITGPGQRVFDILYNGTVIFPGVDIYALAGGKHIGIVLSYTVADQPSTVTVTTRNITQNAILNGVEVVSSHNTFAGNASSASHATGGLEVLTSSGDVQFAGSASSAAYASASFGVSGAVTPDGRLYADNWDTQTDLSITDEHATSSHSEVVDPEATIGTLLESTNTVVVSFPETVGAFSTAFDDSFDVFSLLSTVGLLIYDPNKLYRFRVRVRQQAAAGSPVFNLGWRNLDTDLNNVGADEGRQLALASSYTPTVGDWVELNAWVSGEGTRVTKAPNTSTSNDPNVPDTGTRYLRLYLTFNDDDDNSGNVADLDFIIIDTYDVAAGAGGFDSGFDSGFETSDTPVTGLVFFRGTANAAMTVDGELDVVEGSRRVDLSGSAPVVSAADGNLDDGTPGLMSGSARNASSADGSLIRTVDLGGDADVASSADADLRSSVNLSGSADVASSASGHLVKDTDPVEGSSTPLQEDVVRRVIFLSNREST